MVEGKPAFLRFTVRKMRSNRRSEEFAHFYNASGGKIFSARCDRIAISSFFERMNYPVRRSRSGKTIYIDGDRGEELFRKLIIFSGCKQCIKRSAKVPEIAEAVAALGELETIFWFSKIVEEYEKKGFWGVCRVARSFRTLYRID